MPSPDHYGAARQLLEGKLAAAQDDDRLDPGGHGHGDHQHQGDGLKRHGLAETGGDAVGPGARRVDDDRRLEGAARRRQTPTAAAPR
jgi:hypothetical protein